MFIKIASVTCLLITSMLNIQSLHANTLKTLIDTLENNGSITADQHQILNNAMADEDQLRANPLDLNQPFIDNQQGLVITSSDGEFNTEIHGSLAIDVVRYYEDENKLGDGSELRRAKIKLQGRQHGEWLYELNIDFSGEDVDLDDAYIASLTPFPWRWKFGQFKPSFSLEQLTRSRNMTFMERALPNALAPKRAIGFGAIYNARDWRFSAALLGEPAGNDPDDEGDEGLNLSSRITYAPVAEDNQTLHFGLALSLQSTNDEDKIKLDIRPESHLTEVKFLNTGKIKNSEEVRYSGLELAWVQGSFSLQGEFMQAEIKRKQGVTLAFSGWYSQMSYFITGESRQYKTERAVFASVKPLSNQGAVEIAVRISQLDLNDADTTGGKGKQITLGLNWYLTQQTKLMINYSQLDYDEFADDDGDVNGKDHASFIQTRLQIEF